MQQDDIVIVVFSCILGVINGCFFSLLFNLGSKRTQYQAKLYFCEPYLSLFNEIKLVNKYKEFGIKIEKIYMPRLKNQDNLIEIFQNDKRIGLFNLDLSPDYIFDDKAYQEFSEHLSNLPNS